MIDPVIGNILWGLQIYMQRYPSKNFFNDNEALSLYYLYKISVFHGIHGKYWNLFSPELPMIILWVYAGSLQF